MCWTKFVLLIALFWFLQMTEKKSKSFYLNWNSRFQKRSAKSDSVSLVSCSLWAFKACFDGHLLHFYTQVLLVQNFIPLKTIFFFERKFFLYLYKYFFLFSVITNVEFEKLVGNSVSLSNGFPLKFLPFEKRVLYSTFFYTSSEIVRTKDDFRLSLWQCTWKAQVTRL